MAIRDVARGSSGLRTIVNDSLAIGNNQTTIQDTRILVLGFFKSAKTADGEDVIPVQSVYPESPGLMGTATLSRHTLNYSEDVSPVAYPSEVSIMLEELANAGATNVQVIRLGDDARYTDVSGPMARERYIALEAAYDLVQDDAYDLLIPCNVAAGKVGDGLYNSNTLGAGGESVSVIYDPERYAEVKAADPADPRLRLSSVPGFVAGDEVDYLKGNGIPDTRKEDLCYQAADAAQTLSENGNRCDTIIRTMAPIEVRHLLAADLSATSSMVGADVLANVAGGSADTWVLSRFKGRTFADTDLDLAAGGTHGDKTTAELLKLLEEAAYFVDRETNASLDAAGGVPTVKAVFRLSSQPIYAAGSVSHLEVLSWSLAFGVPTRSEMKKWSKFNIEHGNGSADVFQGSVCSFIDMDGRTSATGEAPDNFLFYATESHEKPTSANEAGILGDANDVAVDLGAHIDLLAANSILAIGASANLISSASPKPFTFGAGVGTKGGITATLPNNRSALATTISSLRPLGLLGGRSVKEMVRSGFQVIRDEDGVYTYQNDITKARWVNDTVRSKFTNRLTTRIVKQAQDFAIAEGKRLRGKTDTPENMAGLQQRVSTQLQKWQEPSDGRFRTGASIGVAVSTTSAGEAIGRVIIRLSLPVQGEVQDVTVISDVNFA